MGIQDGIKSDRRKVKRVEPLLSVADFKRRFLHGIETMDNIGVEISDQTYSDFLDTAISSLEHDLDISIMERDAEEEKDYHANEWMDWGYAQLNNLPVLPWKDVDQGGTDKLTITYLRDASGAPIDVLKIPGAWIRIRPDDGQLRLVPNNAIPSSLMINSGGSFFPELFNRYATLPQVLDIKYRCGFEDGKVPLIMNQAVGLLASIYVMISAADLLLGTGIVSQSISLDGLSQAISTSASAENTTFSARIKENSRLLFGETGMGAKGNRGILAMLRTYYQGQSFNII